MNRPSGADSVNTQSVSKHLLVQNSNCEREKMQKPIKKSLTKLNWYKSQAVTKLKIDQNSSCAKPQIWQKSTVDNTVIVAKPKLLMNQWMNQ